MSRQESGSLLRAALVACATVAVCCGAAGSAQAQVVIASVSPSCGPLSGGSVVTITGGGFAVRTTAVAFGSVLGTNVVVWGPDSLTVVAPGVSSPTTVDVTVSVPGGIVTYPAGYTYAASCPSSAPPPQIGAVSPGKVPLRGPTFTLTVDGINFVNGAVVTWQPGPSGVASAKATTFVSSTRLLATITDADIAVMPPAGWSAVRVTNPDGKTSAAWNVPLIPGWQIVGAGDFSGDQRADLLFESSDGYLALWVMNGFVQAASTRLSPYPVASGGWHVKAVGDLNGDRWPDLVWENTNGYIAAWYMNGPTTVHTALLSPGPAASGGWHIAGAGDLTGDGVAEIIWIHDAGYVAGWFAGGTSILLDPGPAASGGFRLAGVADVNHDLRADLVWYTPGGGVAVWLMNGATKAVVFAALAPGNVPYPWRVAAVGDLNADGNPDVVLQSDAGPPVSNLWAYLMNASFDVITNSGALSPATVYITAPQ